MAWHGIGNGITTGISTVITTLVAPHWYHHTGITTLVSPQRYHQAWNLSAIRYHHNWCHQAWCHRNWYHHNRYQGAGDLIPIWGRFCVHLLRGHAGLAGISLVSSGMASAMVSSMASSGMAPVSNGIIRLPVIRHGTSQHWYHMVSPLVSPPRYHHRKVSALVSPQVSPHWYHHTGITTLVSPQRYLSTGTFQPWYQARYHHHMVSSQLVSSQLVSSQPVSSQMVS